MTNETDHRTPGPTDPRPVAEDLPGRPPGSPAFQPPERAAVPSPTDAGVEAGGPFADEPRPDELPQAGGPFHPEAPPAVHPNAQPEPFDPPTSPVPVIRPDAQPSGGATDIPPSRGPAAARPGDVSADSSPSGASTDAQPSGRSTSDGRAASAGERYADAGVAEEWQRIQSDFVDDPSAAVRGADELLTRVIQDRQRHYAERHEALRRASDDTEELRTILREYRGFLEQLTQSY